MAFCFFCPFLVVFFAPEIVSAVTVKLLMLLPYPHGTVKWFLEASQGLLLHQSYLLWIVVFGLTSGALVDIWPRLRLWGLLTCSAVAFAVPHYGFVNIALLVLALAAFWYQKKGENVPNWLLWCFPFLPLFLPGTINKFNRGPIARFCIFLLRSIVTMIFFLIWFWGDRLSHYSEVREDLADWPEELLDPEIRQLAKSPADVRADWHGIRILDDFAIVSCERNPRLVAFSLTSDQYFEYPLSARWGKDFAGPLEAEVDQSTGTVWTVDGGDKLLELQWSDSQFKLKRTIELPVPLSFSYITKNDSNLLLVTVQAANRGPRRILKVPLPEGTPVRNVRINQEMGPAPMPREMIWVPTIDKLIVAPDFGRHLYKIDLNTGFTEPWLEVPTLNGKMVWEANAGRIILALPNKQELWVIDPEGPDVERKIPTQPGVRAVAVDQKNGLVLTASVVTGQIWVQDLHTGEVRRKLGTVYPMVRELAVAEELGMAVLTTWAAVYKINYLQ
jgi:hypothetical protein